MYYFDIEASRDVTGDGSHLPDVEPLRQAIERLRDGIEDEAFSYYKRLERLRGYVMQNLSEDLSLRTAAGVAVMEPTSFSRFFKGKVGIPYSEWVTRLRLLRAVELMCESNLSVLDVALAVGFSEKRTFERAFKRLLESTPGRFKLSIRPC